MSLEPSAEPQTIVVTFTRTIDRTHMARIGRLGGQRAAAKPHSDERLIKARAAFRARFEQLADPNGELDPIERTQRAEALRHDFYRQLGRRSGLARQARAQQVAP